MPKVTDAYRRGRRDHILDAARRCFLRSGFHATSMQDVLREAGMSSGAFYLHFASKDELIIAIAEDNVREVTAIVRQNREGGSAECLGGVLGHALAAIIDRHARDGLADLAIHVWSEALTNPTLSKRLQELLAELRDDITDGTEVGGVSQGPVERTAVATVLAAVLPGLILQLAVVGPAALANVDVALRDVFPQRMVTQAGSQSQG